MLVYLIVFVSASFLFHFGCKEQLKWNPLSLGAILLVSIFAGFRDLSVGTDTQTYYEFFKDISKATSLGKANEFEGTEPLFSTASYYFAKVNLFGLVLFLYQYITLICLYNVVWRVKKHIVVFVAFWIYFMFFFNLSLNIMRQITAVFYVVDISLFLLDGKKKKFILLSLLSVFIHSSAIVACFIIYVIYAICRKKGKSKKFFIFLYLSSLLIFYFVFSQLGSVLELIAIGRFGDYESYLNSNTGDLSNSDILYRFIFISLLVISLKLGIVEKPVRGILILLIITELACYGLGIFNKWLTRTSFYLLPYVLYFVCYFVNSKKFTLHSREIMNLLYCLLGLVYWVFINYIAGSNETIPYKFNVI